MTQLRELSRGTKNKLTTADAYNIAAAIVGPVPMDSALSEGLAQLLTSEQMAYQYGQKPGLDAGKLLNSLSHHLGLQNAPEYLQLRQYELNKIRLQIWIQLPDLTTGLDRQQVHKGSQLFGPVMSPFEAYLASQLLVYQKLFNNAYVRTSAEESAARGLAAKPVSPGLYPIAPNSRHQEFQQHFAAVVQQWKGHSEVVRIVSNILEESRND